MSFTFFSSANLTENTQQTHSVISHGSETENNLEFALDQTIFKQKPSDKKWKNLAKLIVFVIVLIKIITLHSIEKSGIVEIKPNSGLKISQFILFYVTFIYDFLIFLNINDFQVESRFENQKTIFSDRKGFLVCHLVQFSVVMITSFLFWRFSNFKMHFMILFFMTVQILEIILFAIFSKQKKNLGNSNEEVSQKIQSLSNEIKQECILNNEENNDENKEENEICFEDFQIVKKPKEKIVRNSNFEKTPSKRLSKEFKVITVSGK